MRIGVLSLQGDFREHIQSLRECGAEAFPLNRVEELVDIDALVLPGGESTTISKLARSFGLFDPIVRRIEAGLPVFGSCAGMILLADHVLDSAPGQETFGGINMTVRRNAFGRQVDSFEADVSVEGIAGSGIRAVFIRAPWIENVSGDAQVLAEVSYEGTLHPVAVRQQNLLATSFHPELTSDLRVHQYFVDEIVAKRTR